MTGYKKLASLASYEEINPRRILCNTCTWSYLFQYLKKKSLGNNKGLHTIYCFKGFTVMPNIFSVISYRNFYLGTEGTWNWYFLIHGAQAFLGTHSWLSGGLIDISIWGHLRALAKRERKPIWFQPGGWVGEERVELHQIASCFFPTEVNHLWALRLSIYSLAQSQPYLGIKSIFHSGALDSWFISVHVPWQSSPHAHRPYCKCCLVN